VSQKADLLVRITNQQQNRENASLVQTSLQLETKRQQNAKHDRNPDKKRKQEKQKE